MGVEGSEAAGGGGAGVVGGGPPGPPEASDDVPMTDVARETRENTREVVVVAKGRILFRDAAGWGKLDPG